MRGNRVTFDRYDKRQRRAIISLLEEAFGSKYTDYYLLQLDRIASTDTTYLLEDETGKLIAHIQVVPYYAYLATTSPPLKAAYLYAICTANATQGQGVMTAFLSDTLHRLPAQGYDSALLLPASLDLVTYYQRFGFTPMRGRIYSHLPKAYRPAVRPGNEASGFITEAEKLDQLLLPDSTTKNSIDFNPKAPQIKQTVAPWMHNPLQNSSPYPPDTALLSPMT